MIEISTMQKTYCCRIAVILLLACSLLTFTVSHAQWYDPDKVNKKAGDIYGQAYEEARDGKYTASIQHINEAIVLEPKFVDAFLSRAGIYANLKNYKASVSDFEKAMGMDSVYSKTFLLPYSISLAGTGDFRKALQAVNEFLQNPKLNSQSIKAGNYRKSTYAFFGSGNSFIAMISLMPSATFTTSARALLRVSSCFA